MKKLEKLSKDLDGSLGRLVSKYEPNGADGAIIALLLADNTFICRWKNASPMQVGEFALSLLEQAAEKAEWGLENFVVEVNKRYKTRKRTA